MSHYTLTGRASALALCLLVAAAACGKTDKTEERDAGAVATVANLAVTEVELGKGVDADKRVVDKTDDFDPGDVVYASVATTGSASNAELKARWTFEDGQVVEETSQTVSPTGPSVTEFHISKPGGLPKGKYKLEVLLNGSVVESEEFKIE
ncbi:MAG: hypothetical protein ABR543_10505 [Gemmatimonadaceae bacterium]